MIDPFAAPYFSRALTAAAALREAPGRGRIGEFEVVGELAEAVLVTRRADRNLVVLKGFTVRTPESLARREAEALRMLRFGFGGILPIEQTVGDPGGPLHYLCLPHCPGGSLRDRLAAGLDPAELAYHGLALACALRRLHREGVVHGDVKPENVLFAHEDGWHTVLADLETLAETGGPTSWRLTEGYAAPEQIAGAPADPAMDVWAWGRTLRDGPIGWDWLAKLVERALTEDPSARPDTAEIIDCFGQHLGFGDEHTSFLGADPGLTRYPLAALLPQLDSWPRRGEVAEVRLSLGWAAWLPECHQLYQLHTVPALLRIEELSGRALADPALPGGIAPSLHCLRVKALVELLEITGEPADAERLRAAALAWERLGAFEQELDTALLAQSWLMLDDPPRALPYVRRSFAADRESPSALAAMRLYYLVSGEHGTAATVAAQPVRTEDPGMTLRWLLLQVTDLLDAGQYAELDRLLAELAGLRTDLVALAGCVLAGRRGPVAPDAGWQALREFFRTISSTTTVKKLSLLAEAAFQRGELAYASSRADIARRRPVTRIPVNHRDRAVLEAVARQQDPADRSLFARLRNRAELWVADGRPADPLLGLDLLTAHRRSAHLPPEARELLAHSGSPSAELLAGTRYCGNCRTGGPLAELAVCGCCHRTLCLRCTGQSCSCGGDLISP
ncbi:serine/threonine protein kinase [Crossiella sp. NPDC003009]